MNLRNRFEERIWTMNLRNGFEQRNESEEWTWRMDLKNGFEERIKEKERNKLKNGWKGYIKQIIWNTLDTKLPSLGILPNLVERFQLGRAFSTWLNVPGCFIGGSSKHWLAGFGSQPSLSYWKKSKVELPLKGWYPLPANQMIKTNICLSGWLISQTSPAC